MTSVSKPVVTTEEEVVVRKEEVIVVATKEEVVVRKEEEVSAESAESAVSAVPCTDNPCQILVGKLDGSNQLLLTIEFHLSFPFFKKMLQNN